MTYTWRDIFDHASALRTRLRDADSLTYEQKRDAIAQIKRESFDLLYLVDMPHPLRMLVAELWGGHTKPRDFLKDFWKQEPGTILLPEENGVVRTANLYDVAAKIEADNPDISTRELSRRVNERLGTTTDYTRSLGRWRKKRAAAATGG